MVKATDEDTGWTLPRPRIITRATIEQAAATEKTLSAAEHHAADAWYDARHDALAILLTDGRLFGARRGLIPSLAAGSLRQLRGIRVTPDGAFLEIDELDLHINVDGLVTRLLEESALTLRRSAARLAGQTTSQAKATASARNGRLGGRPRKTPGPREVA